MDLLQPVTNFLRRIETRKIPVGEKHPRIISARCRECGTPLVPRAANEGGAMWKCPSTWACKAIVYFDLEQWKVTQAVGDILDLEQI